MIVVISRSICGDFAFTEYRHSKSFEFNVTNIEHNKSNSLSFLRASQTWQDADAIGTDGPSASSSILSVDFQIATTRNLLPGSFQNAFGKNRKKPVENVDNNRIKTRDISIMADKRKNDQTRLIEKNRKMTG